MEWELSGVCKRLAVVLGCTGGYPCLVLCIVGIDWQKAGDFGAEVPLGLRVAVALGLVVWVYRRQIRFRLG